MSMPKLIVPALVLVILLASAPTARANPIVDEVAGEIVCQCGCTYTLEACASAMGCSVGDQMRADIAKLGSQGLNKDQILADYVRRYGETVLAAPTKQGFNLTAWITPFAAILAGGAVVFLLLLAWTRRHDQSPVPVPPRRAIANPYLEQVDRELAEEI